MLHGLYWQCQSQYVRPDKLIDILLSTSDFFLLTVILTNKVVKIPT